MSLQKIPYIFRGEPTNIHENDERSNPRKRTKTVVPSLAVNNSDFCRWKFVYLFGGLFAITYFIILPLISIILPDLPFPRYICWIPAIFLSILFLLLIMSLYGHERSAHSIILIVIILFFITFYVVGILKSLYVISWSWTILFFTPSYICFLLVFVYGIMYCYQIYNWRHHSPTIEESKEDVPFKKSSEEDV